VHEDGDEGGKGMGDVHDRLDKEDEHGQNGDDDVEVCNTKSQLC